MDLNTEYLNRTENKTARNSSPQTTGRIEFVVWHGTDSPNPANTRGTLNWAIINDGTRGAANYYIPQSGPPFWYIDEGRFIAHHAGAGGAKARGHIGFQVNVHSIGIEVEERITKKPKIAATPASLDQAALLAVDIHRRWGIPLERSFHVGHKEIVNANYRSDPHSYSIDAVLAKAKSILAADQQLAIPVDPRFNMAWKISGGIWQMNELTPGYPLGPAFEWQGKVYQLFERGCARLEASGTVSWLLLPEIQELKQATGK
jgi:hypothetical protein